MEQVFSAINNVFRFVTPVSDFFWDFPTNFDWYASIPILGNFSLAIILLVGSGIYFTIRLGFIQVTYFAKGVRLLVRERKKTTTGISSLTAFFLSSAMRVGPGNILGVTGAISTGGPGALFWMWVSAFFGMTTAYVEAVLAQLFKTKKKDEFVGGLPFYGKRLLGNKLWAGVALSIMFIVYAMCCLPAQGFNVVSSIGQMAEIVTGTVLSSSWIYYAIAIIVVLLTAYIAFGGIKKVTRVTDKMVPVMAIVYVLTVLVLIILNANRIPYFFSAVFRGAFRVEAVFGGLFGTVLAQGVKRGLMSNEAGQGTITMAAGAADCKHPCDQGIVQSIGVFLDTLVICTLTGFVVVMAHLWTGADADGWMALGKLPKFLASAAELTPGTALNSVIMFLITFCFCLFAFTCLVGMISFSEIAANRISTKKGFINAIRILGIVITSFGILCSIAGLDLGNLWAISDLGNILIVFANIPLLYLGAKYVFKATEHYRKNDGSAFTGKVIGTECEYWDHIEETK